MRPEEIIKEIQKLETGIKWFYDRNGSGSKEKISVYEYRQYFETFKRIENEISCSLISEHDRQKLRGDYQCSICMLCNLQHNMQPTGNSGIFNGRWGDSRWGEREVFSSVSSMADELQRHIQTTTDGSFRP